MDGASVAIIIPRRIVARPAHHGIHHGRNYGASGVIAGVLYAHQAVRRQARSLCDPASRGIVARITRGIRHRGRIAGASRHQYANMRQQHMRLLERIGGCITFLSTVAYYGAHRIKNWWRREP
jgi:hypothetical protein